MTAFVEVEVEPGPAHEDGLSLRFKRPPGGAARDVAWVRYESDAGLEGDWRVATMDAPDGDGAPGARAWEVEDSSDGVVWLVTGGRHGLALTHPDAPAAERVPYLVLARGAAMG